MKDLYYVNVVINNKHGELVDTRLAFESINDMHNKLPERVAKLVHEAEDYGTENSMLLEDLLEGKEEAEFNKEDTL